MFRVLANREDNIIEIPGKNGDKRVARYDTVSRISLKPTAEDDFAEYTCEARHEALAYDIPMRATVQLSVLYPPGVPIIEGFNPGETFRKGQSVELICRSKSGNPPAQLIWYKNGEQVRMTYRTSGRASENVYAFTADATDNKARYRCEASNIMSKSPLKAEVDMTVLCKLFINSSCTSFFNYPNCSLTVTCHNNWRYRSKSWRRSSSYLYDWKLQSTCRNKMDGYW